MHSNNSNEIIILGVTTSGHTFRPSDWAERLAGVMSSFRPGGAQPGDHLSYSPWCVPNTLDGQKCVIVHTDMRSAHVMAWDFVMGFARDNQLQVIPAQQPKQNRPEGRFLLFCRQRTVFKRRSAQRPTGLFA